MPQARNSRRKKIAGKFRVLFLTGICLATTLAHRALGQAPAGADVQIEQWSGVRRVNAVPAPDMRPALSGKGITVLSEFEPGAGTALWRPETESPAADAQPTALQMMEPVPELPPAAEWQPGASSSLPPLPAVGLNVPAPALPSLPPSPPPAPVLDAAPTSQSEEAVHEPVGVPTVPAVPLFPDQPEFKMETPEPTATAESLETAAEPNVSVGPAPAPTPAAEPASNAKPALALIAAILSLTLISIAAFVRSYFRGPRPDKAPELAESTPKPEPEPVVSPAPEPAVAPSSAPLSPSPAPRPPSFTPLKPTPPFIVGACLPLLHASRGRDFVDEHRKKSQQERALSALWRSFSERGFEF